MKLDEHGVPTSNVRATATAAAREATNREDFFPRATDILGVDVETIPGKEEADLSFTGAVSAIEQSHTHHPAPYVVIDLGGGSTEFAYGVGQGASSTAAVSIPVGCVRVTEMFIKSDPPTEEELKAAEAYVEGQLKPVLQSIPIGEASTFIGVAGTVVILAALELALPEYDRLRVQGHHMSYETLRALYKSLSSQDREGRRIRPGMEDKRCASYSLRYTVVVCDAGFLLWARVDVIVGGACAFCTLMRVLGIQARHDRSRAHNGVEVTTRALFIAEHHRLGR
eukprot:scaffold6671_cov376-Prasinococcus_capsulatus_cf.AAC.2